MKQQIEKLKNEDPKKLVIYAIMVIGLIIAVYSLFENNKEETNPDAISEVQISEGGSIYDSKLAAYNAKRKAEQENIATNYQYDISTYLNSDTLENVIHEISEYETDDEDIRRLQDALRGKTNEYVSPNELNSSYQTSSSSQIADQRPVITTQKSQKKEEKHPEAPEIATYTEPEPEPEPEEQKSRFYRGSQKQERGNTVPCVVHGEQVVSNGSTLKMRLLEDIVSKEGVTIPKNTYVYGIVKITEERINIELQTVRVGKNIYSIEKTVFDRDGIKGINVPANIKAEIAKQASASAIDNADVNNNSGTNIISKTANAAANITKSVLSKDQREIKVTIKSNYKLFLK